MKILEPQYISPPIEGTFNPPSTPVSFMRSTKRPRVIPSLPSGRTPEEPWVLETLGASDERPCVTAIRVDPEGSVIEVLVVPEDISEILGGEPGVRVSRTFPRENEVPCWTITLETLDRGEAIGKGPADLRVGTFARKLDLRGHGVFTLENSLDKTGTSLGPGDLTLERFTSLVPEFKTSNPTLSQQRSLSGILKFGPRIKPPPPSPLTTKSTWSRSDVQKAIRHIRRLVSRPQTVESQGTKLGNAWVLNTLQALEESASSEEEEEFENEKSDGDNDDEFWTKRARVFQAGYLEILKALEPSSLPASGTTLF